MLNRCHLYSDGLRVERRNDMSFDVFNVDMKEVKIRTVNLDDAPTIASVLGAPFLEHISLYTVKACEATTPSESIITTRFDEGESWIVELEEQLVGTVSVIPKAM